MAGPLRAEVIAVLNERAAARVADDLEDRIGNSGRSASESFNRSLSQGLRSMPLRQIGVEAGNEFRTGMRNGIDDVIRDFTSQFGALGQTANSAFSGITQSADGAFAGISRGGAVAAAGVAGVGLAAVAAGKQLYDLGVQWDSVTDGIALRTGKVGSDLDALMNTVREIGGKTAAPLESIGDIAGRVSQSLGLMGPELAAMTTTLSEFQAATGQAVDIHGMGKVFAQFDVSPQNMTAALNSLYDASVDTGVELNGVIASMQKAGAAARGFGLDFNQTAGLVSTLEDAGVDLAKALPGMSFALRTFAQDGVAPAAGLSQTIAKIKELNDAGRESAARSLAIESFGARGYEQIYDAVVNGKLGADAFNDSLNGVNTSLQKTLDGTKDLSDQWTMFTNQLETDLAPAAEAVFAGINGVIQRYMIQPLNELRDIGNLWGLLDSGTPPMPVDPRTGLPASQSNAPAGTRDSGGLPVVIDPRTGLPPGQAATPAGTRESGGLPGSTPGSTSDGPAPGMWWGPDVLPPPPENPRFGSQYDAAATAGTAGLPQAPSLPLQYTSTAGLDSQIANATTRLDEARHSVAEKTARLNQLEQANVGTAEDVQKARNDLAKANQDQLQAEQALTDARIKSTEQANKQLGKLSSDMTDLGNQLDADFGISKGIGGIIENAVKALGNALTAPFLAALGMVEKANPNEGSGLTGILAANGVLGSQYTPAAIAAAQASGAPGYGAGTPAAYGQYGVPGAAKPGESARDFAHRAMKPYFEAQGFEVGDHQADRYGEHQNGALDIMVPNIASGNQVLQQVLSDPNVYGAIFNNKAYGYGQGATPRNYSGGFTGDPTQDHQDHVHAWYKPGGTNNIVPPASVYPGSPGGPAPGLAGVPMMPGGPLGNGMPSASPFGGPPSVSPASFGGPGTPPVGPGQAYPSQGGNSGNVLGGLALDGMMAATSMADMMMPGAGAAAKIGIQLMNRTIGYAAQNAGILASGVGETLSIGDNPRGSLGSSWLGKLAGGIAGAAPALPNIAGGKPPGPMEQPGGDKGKAGNTYGDTNIQVQAREGASGQEHGEQIAAETSRMYAPAGKQ